MARNSHKRLENIKKILNIRKYLFEESEFDIENIDLVEYKNSNGEIKSVEIFLPRSGGGMKDPNSGFLLKGGIGRLTFKEFWEGEEKKEYIYRFVSCSFDCQAFEKKSEEISDKQPYNFHFDNAPKHGPHISVIYPTIRFSQNKNEDIGLDQFLNEIESNFYFGDKPRVRPFVHKLWSNSVSEG